MEHRSNKGVIKKEEEQKDSKNTNEEMRNETTRQKKNNYTGQTQSVPKNIAEKLLGKVLIKDKIDISQISQLDEKNLRYLEILGEGGFGIVRKAYDIQQTIFLAIKYLKMDKSKTVIEEIAGEDFLLEKINQIKSPSLLQYYGLQKDPKSEGNLVLVMESGETTLENLLKQNLRFNQNELLYILYDLTNQLLLLQRNGICNRDIKPDNFIIVKNPENGKYSFKIADFGIGCYIESKDKYLIPISDFSTCTPKFASPEAMKIFEDEYDDFNYYDPFLSDVYSLAKSFQFMITLVFSVLIEEGGFKVGFKYFLLVEQEHVPIFFSWVKNLLYFL